eukprot:TRINITY_DN4478_c0_g1_i3.p1 TRINITY_DN4478_c0_g1~~TRINITY_DN4478_c0_g1_i3.p1  ORF type:complete len:727 (-),score=234.60 TRINITY_DN4478_c0_g1_i3:7-2187(-)
MSEQEERFFPGDIVTLKAKEGSFGTITRVNWLPDSDDEHWEYFDFVDDDLEEPVKAGSVEVLWNESLKVVQVASSRLRVVDRGFVHGDIVASAEDPTGQNCTVTDVILTVDLKMVKSSLKIPNVSPIYLTDIHPFMIGRHVTKKDQKQVGTIDDVICDVEVKFSDRTKCILRQATPKILKALEDDVSDDEVEPERNYLYYPSQQVAATQQVWDSAEWLTKRKPVKTQRAKKQKQRIPGTVTRVIPSQIVVYWHGGTEIEESCNPDDLLLLNHFKHTKFEIGDYTMINPNVRTYFQERAKAAAQVMCAPKKAKKGKQPAKAKKGKGKKDEPLIIEPEEVEEEKEEEKEEAAEVADLTNISNIVPEHEELIANISEWTGTDEECAQIIATHTHVRVQWQDGSQSGWMPSTSFVPRKYLLDCEFLPGKFVRLEDKDATGIIKKVDPRDKVATILWLESDGTTNEEELSIYDIMERQDKKFRLGGVVKSVTGDKIGEVKKVEGDKIHVVWSDNVETTLPLYDLEAVDTDEEDEGSDDEEEEEIKDGVQELTQDLKEIVLEDIPDNFEPQNTAKFRNLDAVGAHHFLVNEPPPRVLRLASREWKRLEDGLPEEGISVVSFQNRTDIMKALILGPEGTIFYNSYFIFDIALPKGYPHYPPLVHYVSTGGTGQLNPNLRVDGTVCLSLLGTWSGDGSERWHPNKSRHFLILSPFFLFLFSPFFFPSIFLLSSF